jgi:hypothetical protein
MKAAIELAKVFLKAARTLIYRFLKLASLRKKSSPPQQLLEPIIWVLETVGNSFVTALAS